MRAVVAQHQVGLRAVEQQVCRFEGQGESLNSFTEIKSVPQVVVGGVHKEVLGKKKGERNEKNTRSNGNVKTAITHSFISKLI